MLISSEVNTTELKAKLFRGFSDPSRLSILEALRSGPLIVSQIIAATGLSQSNTSNHLACLYDCGLLQREQKGRQVIYRLSDDRVEKLLHLSDELLAGAAGGVRDCKRYSMDEGDLP